MTGYMAPIDDLKPYAVPGFDQLGEYNLTVETVTQSAWHLQQKYGAGSAGPSVSDFNSFITSTGVGNLKPEDYTFFNLPVCDIDNLPTKDSVNDYISKTECNGMTNSILGSKPSGVDPTVCSFLVKLTCLCGAASYSPAEWPWATNASETCLTIQNQ